MNNGAMTAPVRSLATNNGPANLSRQRRRRVWECPYSAHQSRRMRVNLNFGVENGGSSGEDREKRTESKLFPCLSDLFSRLKSFWGGRKQILVYRYVAIYYNRVWEGR